MESAVATHASAGGDVKPGSVDRKATEARGPDACHSLTKRADRSADTEKAGSSADVPSGKAGRSPPDEPFCRRRGAARRRQRAKRQHHHEVADAERRGALRGSLQMQAVHGEFARQIAEDHAAHLSTSVVVIAKCDFDDPVFFAKVDSLLDELQVIAPVVSCKGRGEVMILSFESLEDAHDICAQYQRSQQFLVMSASEYVEIHHHGRNWEVCPGLPNDQLTSSQGDISRSQEEGCRADALSSEHGTPCRYLSSEEITFDNMPISGSEVRFCPSNCRAALRKVDADPVEHGGPPITPARMRPPITLCEAGLARTMQRSLSAVIAPPAGAPPPWIKSGCDSAVLSAASTEFQTPEKIARPRTSERPSVLSSEFSFKAHFAGLDAQRCSGSERRHDVSVLADGMSVKQFASDRN